MSTPLHARLHHRLARLRDMDELLTAEWQAFGEAEKRLKRLAGNAAISSADEETLRRLEEEYGIETYGSKPPDERRSVLIALLRGRGTTTPEMIRRLSLAFNNGDVEVIQESSKPYEVVLKFVSVRGKPPNMDDFYRAIREIIPAHLKVQYVFTWMTWDEFDAYNKTWDQWDALGLTWDEIEVFHEE